MKTKPFVPQRTHLALAITLALAGCGGGGGGSPAPVTPPNGGGNPPPPPVSTTVSGVVTDGYVSGATVYLDLNNNNIKDANEPGATTDASGHYSLTATGSAAELNGKRLRMFGGTDLSTGQAFSQAMSAVIEDAASKPFVPVSPFGSVIDGMLASGAASSVAQARDMLAKVFGLSSGAALDKDPLSLAASEPSLLQKMVALQKSIEVLAMSEKSAAETGTAAAMARVASAVGAEIARTASSMGAGAPLPAVGTLVAGAVANQDRFLNNRPAAHGSAALAADVANVTEATLAVAVSQLLSNSPADASGATLQAALATYVDSRLKVIEPLQDGAVQRAAQITQAPSGDPLRLESVAREGGSPAELLGLVVAAANLGSIPTASRGSLTGLDNVRGAVDHLPGTGLPTPAPTQPPTQPPTAPPTIPPTMAPTQPPAEPPGDTTPTPAPTQAPTQPPSQPGAPTPAPTFAPTPAPSLAPPPPNQTPTTAPGPAPTSAPTAPPTQAPTVPPTHF